MEVIEGKWQGSRQLYSVDHDSMEKVEGEGCEVQACVSTIPRCDYKKV